MSVYISATMTSFIVMLHLITLNMSCTSLDQMRQVRGRMGLTAVNTSQVSTVALPVQHLTFNSRPDILFFLSLKVDQEEM